MEPTTHAQKQIINLLDLPTEILTDICARLCPHCRINDIVVAPLRVAMTARTSQKDLSRLSICSRGLQTIAQPILFHWFPDLERQIWPLSFTRLLSFSLAIMQRPELAASVRAMTLYTPFLDPEARIDEPRFALMNERFRDVEVIYRQTAAALGGQLVERSRRPHFVNFQDLVMAISPKLTRLCLQRPFQFLQHDWGYDLTNLTYLAFPGKSHQPFLHNNDDRAYHLYHARQLLRHTPNLQTLIAPDCIGDWQYLYWEWYRHEPWGVPLPRLKRLSTNGLMIHELQRIVECCPALEDLEFFDDDSADPNFNEVLDPDRHLNHVRTTLKRLCYSTLALGFEYDESEMMEAAQFQLAGYRSGSGMSFSSFPALEELEIEQYLLYGPIFPRTWNPAPGEDRSALLSTPTGFIARLPPSLRVLRVGCCMYWSTLYRDLLVLAEQAAQFPQLQHVILEILQIPPRADRQRLADVFRAGNVTVTIRSAFGRHGKRGLLPPRPGHPPAGYLVYQMI